MGKFGNGGRIGTESDQQTAEPEAEGGRSSPAGAGHAHQQGEQDDDDGNAGGHRPARHEQGFIGFTAEEGMLAQVVALLLVLFVLGRNADIGIVATAALFITVGQPADHSRKERGQQDGTEVAAHGVVGEQVRQVHALVGIGRCRDQRIGDPGLSCLQREAEKHAGAKAGQDQRRAGQVAGEVGQHPGGAAAGKGHAETEQQATNDQAGVDRVHPEVHVLGVLVIQESGGGDGGGGKHQHQAAHQAGGTGAIGAVNAAGKAQSRTGQCIAKAEADQQTEKDVRCQGNAARDQNKCQQQEATQVFGFIHRCFRLFRGSV